MAPREGVSDASPRAPSPREDRPREAPRSSSKTKSVAKTANATPPLHRFYRFGPRARVYRVARALGTAPPRRISRSTIASRRLGVRTRRGRRPRTPRVATPHTASCSTESSPRRRRARPRIRTPPTRRRRRRDRRRDLRRPRRNLARSRTGRPLGFSRFEIVVHERAREERGRGRFPGLARGLDLDLAGFPSASASSASVSRSSSMKSMKSCKSSSSSPPS